jgi:hypothetical protein
MKTKSSVLPSPAMCVLGFACLDDAVMDHVVVACLSQVILGLISNSW